MKHATGCVMPDSIVVLACIFFTNIFSPQPTAFCCMPIDRDWMWCMDFDPVNRTEGNAWFTRCTVDSLRLRILIIICIMYILHIYTQYSHESLFLCAYSLSYTRNVFFYTYFVSVFTTIAFVHSNSIRIPHTTHLLITSMYIVYTRLNHKHYLWNVWRSSRFLMQLLFIHAEAFFREHLSISAEIQMHRLGHIYGRCCPISMVFAQMESFDILLLEYHFSAKSVQSFPRYRRSIV